MGATRNYICGILFWTKFVFATFLACSGLGLLCWKVTLMHQDGLRQRQRSQPVARPIDISDPQACQYQRGTLGRVEPPNGKLMWGMSLDWALITPMGMSDRLNGFRPAVTNVFLPINESLTNPVDWNMLTWHAQQIALIGGIMELTMQPTNIALIPDAVYETFAIRCRDINSVYGVPILLRWGHEMNGPWATYGMKPAAYKASFRKMADLIHRYTNVTAMVWAPNIGIAYPFGGTLPPAPEDMLELDTNNDGSLTYLDDPYMPFYPGDEYVDWVGTSLYWYPDASTGYNIPAPDTYFVDYLRGRGPTVEQFNPIIANDPNQYRDFYGRFSEARNKPMIIAESGAPWFPTQPPGVLTELDIKRQWWTQIWNAALSGALPRLKGIVQFEEIKMDDGNPLLRDWRVTEALDIRKAYVDALTAERTRLVHAEDMSFTCAGTIVFNN